MFGDALRLHLLTGHRRADHDCAALLQHLGIGVRNEIMGDGPGLVGLVAHHEMRPQAEVGRATLRVVEGGYPLNPLGNLLARFNPHEIDVGLTGREGLGAGRGPTLVKTRQHLRRRRTARPAQRNVGAVEMGHTAGPKRPAGLHQLLRLFVASAVIKIDAQALEVVGNPSRYNIDVHPAVADVI